MSWYFPPLEKNHPVVNFFSSILPRTTPCTRVFAGNGSPGQDICKYNALGFKAIYNWPPNTRSVSTCDNRVINKPLDWSLHCTLARLTAYPTHSTALHLLTPFTGSLTTLWEHWNSCVHAENAFSRNNRDWRCHWKHTHLSTHQRSCMFLCFVSF